MLFAQANALQAIFMSFSRRALTQQYQHNLEAFLRMGLKAQNQCRMTLETLATIKNPPTVYARQANINNGGQQQVNNGSATESGPVRARTRKSQDSPSKLLEEHDVERLDTGAQSAPVGTDTKLAAVGAVHRTKKRNR
jgi:hypothetical protein